MNITIQNIAGLSVFIEQRTLPDHCSGANIIYYMNVQIWIFYHFQARHLGSLHKMNHWMVQCKNEQACMHSRILRDPDAKDSNTHSTL